ncbi:MAG: hypothetical protein HYX66_03725 [Ignavibacteria bacterium]|nr:hypothetical protein [Ignavibacteria bacterium]
MYKMCAYALFSIAMCAAHAQTYFSEGLRDHIAFDVGVWLPFGEVGSKLDMEPSAGFNIHFWKVLSENVFVVGSVGNGWLRMGTNAKTDTGVYDLSNYTLTASPLLGGIGYVLSLGEVVNAWFIGHAGATIINVTEGRGPPVTYISDNAYFTLGATLGTSYRVSEVVSILFGARYQKLFGDDLQHADIGIGASYRW